MQHMSISRVGTCKQLHILISQGICRLSSCLRTLSKMSLVWAQ